MKNKKIKKIYYLVVLNLTLPFISHAYEVPTPNRISIPNTAGANSIQELLARFLAWIVNIGTVAVVLAFIYTGFQFVTSRGNPEMLKKSKTSFLWTVVGALILLGAHVLVAVIENTLNQSGVSTR